MSKLQKKVKGQHTLTFSREFREFVPEDQAMVGEAEFKSRMMRKGYIYRDFTAQKLVLFRAIAAKANWPRELRIKRQAEIDKMPRPTSFFLHSKTKPKKS